MFRAYIAILLKEINSDAAEAILTLEEPEAHLHPQAVRALQKSIEEINCQKIITTHSPFFIQNVDIRNVRYIHKWEGRTRIAKVSDSYCFKIRDIKEGLRRAVAANSEVIELDEENSEITIKKPIGESIANMLRGCCSPVEVSLDRAIEDATNIFSLEELHTINMCIQRNRGDILFARKWFLYEGQTEDVILPYFANLLGKDFDELGINGIMYRNNGSAKAFVKLAKVLNIPWFVLGDNDQQGEKTIKEVKGCGYDDTIISERVILTNEKDIEHELVENTEIMADYETFIFDELSPEEQQLKLTGKNEEFKLALVKKIQDGKVENAYKLLERWQEKGFSENDIPEFFKSLIEKV